MCGLLLGGVLAEDQGSLQGLLKHRKDLGLRVAVRKEVEDFVAFCSPMPSEDDGTQFEIEECERLYNLMERPVSDEEAQVLATTFGDDTCYGLAWAILHLIETAPGAMTAVYRNESSNFWVDMLNRRVAFAREMGES